MSTQECVGVKPSLRQQVGTFGQRLEGIAALARGPEHARQDAKAKAHALKREMRQFDADLQRCGAPERSMLQVMRYVCRRAISFKIMGTFYYANIKYVLLGCSVTDLLSFVRCPCRRAVPSWQCSAAISSCACITAFTTRS